MNNLYEGKRQKAKGSFVLPTPQTLHPTPHTLHPTPQTPHPTPHTPHPLLITENSLACVLPIWWVQ
ncbi:MAG: hypothetical protein IM507_21345 [Microcystis sp. M20BS1]|uniref:hypothetical protein n=1 Tax=Microcystis TaxID=1125 RepID=UPI000F459EC7|nr:MULTISPECIES: hypothetical protein [Microcystis]MCA2623298.1 hypothetical protein [Microcystis sp. M19BS1]MCA2634835.1 hypothetical protein [Microcystis sp. M20BS1]ROH98326.1 hypothetical protein ED562_18145 [Microcystis aeruginosa FACHB-524]